MTSAKAALTVGAVVLVAAYLAGCAAVALFLWWAGAAGWAILHA